MSLREAVVMTALVVLAALVAAGLVLGLACACWRLGRRLRRNRGEG